MDIRAIFVAGFFQYLRVQVLSNKNTKRTSSNFGANHVPGFWDRLDTLRLATNSHKKWRHKLYIIVS